VTCRVGVLALQIRNHRIDQPFQRRPIKQTSRERTKVFARTAHR
jgi:hypothetical protein